MNDYKPHPASFRDPAGFVFELEGKYFRQVNQTFADHYEHLKTSGLYDQLVKEKKLLQHVELNDKIVLSDYCYKTILPEQLVFISYPYEWCFEQWKDAALLTLQLVKDGIDKGMILKDATPFNIQFVGNKPIFIDTLSFEKYDETKPWIAYRQFTECFLAPLLLAQYHSPDLLKMFQLYPDGIPMALTARLLKGRAILNPNIFLHIRLPQKISVGKSRSVSQPGSFTKKKLINIVSNLQSFVRSIELKASVSTWNNYYEETVLSSEYVDEKMKIIQQWLKDIPAVNVLDMGTNAGLFAEAAAAAGKFTIAVDADTFCIDKLYLQCRKKKVDNLISLCIDITNPTPAIGWNNNERTGFLSRAKTDLTMALALIHHLAIGRNIGFDQLATLFSNLSPYLIIEFVPKNDPKVVLLLRDRDDIFENYTEENFLDSFQQQFEVLKQDSITGTGRKLFLMKRVVRHYAVDS